MPYRCQTCNRPISHGAVHCEKHKRVYSKGTLIPKEPTEAELEAMIAARQATMPTKCFVKEVPSREPERRMK